MERTSLFDLSGKVALVTGGSRGIGRALAVGLAAHGADIALIFRARAEAADEVCRQVTAMGRRCVPFRFDLAQTESIAGLVDEVWEALGKIDILVNNAAISSLNAFERIDLTLWRNIMVTNVDAVFFASQRVAVRMIESGIRGRIINVTSKNAFVAEAGLAHYNASKAAVELITKTLAIELGGHGITVNTLAPGITDTDLLEDPGLDWSRFRTYYEDHIPLQHRFGKPAEYVGATVFLASQASQYMTGQSLIVDGGVLCEQVPRLRFMSKEGSG